MISRIESSVFVVGPQDIDELEHVNNRVYLRWMEQAARAASAAAGWGSERYFHDGDGVWVAREHWVEYLRPCKLGETITVYTWVEGFSGCASLRRYAMKNAAGKLCCVAATEWNYVNLKTRRAEEIPASLAACFEIIDPDDARLKDLGITRRVRFAPSRGLLREAAAGAVP